MKRDPINPNVIYAATGWVETSNLGHAGIYKSIDFGNTWALLNTGIPFQGTVQRTCLAISPVNNNYIYAISCDNTEGFYGIYKSTDAGLNWTYLPPQLNILEHGQGTGSGGQGPYDLAIYADALDTATIYTGGINIWKSVNGGVSFDPVSHWTLNYGNTLHGDIHFIEKQPGSNQVFVCSDGGLYKTTAMIAGDFISNWQTVWTKLSDGMQVTSFYRLSSSRNSKNRLLAGAQDNASFYYDGTTWSTIFGGDGMDNYLDPLDDNKMVGSSQYGNFYYSDDGGNSGYIVDSNPFNESAEWVTPIAADYNHPGVMYIGNENIVNSTDGGQNWNPLASIFTNTTSLQNTEMSALAVSPTNSHVIWGARRVRYEYNLKGIVFRTTNGGVASFSNVTSNLPDTLYYTGLDASPSSSNEAVICMAGFAGGCKVFRTTNGGGSWTNISFNLPNVPVNSIKYFPSGGHLMAATDLGIYILYNGANAWTSYSSGLPNVITSDIEFNPSLDKIYISTFGRGIWTTSLSQIVGIKSETPPEPIDFTVYPTISAGKFTIEIRTRERKNSLDIFDVKGRVVYSTVLNENKIELNLKLASGMYYLKLWNEGSMGVRRIIIE